jgi:hypothetical protein
MLSTSNADKNPRLLLEAIVALILAFIPFLCISGGIIGFIAIKKSIQSRDLIAKILASLAVFIATLMSVQTGFVVFIFILNTLRAASHS